MRKLFFILSAIIIVTTTIQVQVSAQPQIPAPLTVAQQAKLAAIQEAQFPVTRGPLVLPFSVDNSTQPYFRPLFTQSGLECGQASSIGLGFTYEVDLKRNVPANVASNQYATYFTYDFLNGGSDAGVCSSESWEIVKRCGNPTVADYGGLSAGGSARWMTGYDKYLNSMHNRITDIAVIYLNSADGLNKLKSWIYNHMDQASIGGVATFYSEFTNPSHQLSAGTPEAGKYVLTSWGSSPNHSMTIVGYNDSIRWDYNNDGQYTNTIDINGDGIVDPKDWEIGAFKIANTYGTVYNWGNQGFSYAMYKSFADNTTNGGIWNNAAFIAYAKQDLTPKLTMKVVLKHNCRNKIKVIAGMARNLAATEPEVTLNLPVFDYQGGEKYMQGGTTEADKTIEFGLDATPLISETINGQPAKFFLMVKENDPDNSATGQIVSFDLIDYTNGVSILPSGISNLPLVENGLTTVAVTAAINSNHPSITNTSLPDAKIYERYSQQMNVTGGTPPYKWRIMNDYTESAGNTTFPNVTAQQLTVSNTSSGYATQELPFAFPFYGKTYSKVYPHVDGYIIFEDHPVPWPYIIYEKTFFRNTRCIAPYMSKPMQMDGTDGIWYQGNQDSVTFRWKVSSYSSPSTTDINFAVSLFPDGRITFYYGSVLTNSWDKWISGLSNGDGLNNHFCAITDSLSQPNPNSRFQFSTLPFPSEMSISDDGIFSGTPMRTYSNVPIRFYAEDNNFLYTTKTINFNTKGVEINYQVNAGGDTLVEYGEQVYLTPVLKNVSNTTLHNVEMHLQINDPFVTLIDSTETIGTLLPGQVVTFANAFRFNVANSVINGHLLNIQSHLTSIEDQFNRTIQLPVYSADLIISKVSISDGNDNILLPGETGSLIVSIKNKGGAKATNLSAILSTIDPYLSILQTASSLDTLYGNTTSNLLFTIHAASNCPASHIGFLTITIDGDKDISISDSVYINISTILEDFETGNFTKFPWQLAGNSNWNITSTLPYEGTYCSQSGTITDNQESSMYLVVNILTASEISFYRKVSSENNYDFLYFTMDGIELGKWSGDVPWGKVTFPLASGTHTLKWFYRKDYSISNGSDKAWVDYISFPPISNMLLIAYAGPDDIACSGQGYTLQGQVINAGSVWWSGTGDGTFSNINSANAIYHPGLNDLNNGNVTLSLHASQGTLAPVSDNVTLSVIEGPLVNAGPDLLICPGTSAGITQASCTYQSSVLWLTSGDGTFDNPALLSPIYTPGINDLTNGMVYLTLTATGNSNCSTVSDEITLSFYPEVVTEAGPDQTIPKNSSTILDGSATGGPETFSAAWEPSNLLQNPNIFDPVTTLLNASQQFTLTAVNTSTGCTSSDQMIVTVTGGPLSVTATATPNEICPGASSQLQALGGGGGGNYTYLWSSQPPGFSSVLPNPVVIPDVTTIYSVTLTEGSASVSAQTTVTVIPELSVPLTPLGPAAVNVLITPSSTYSTSGSAGSEFHWNFSPGEAGTIQQLGSSCKVNWNPSFEGLASIWVFATNACSSDSLVSDTLFITANDQISVPELSLQGSISVCPNPGSGPFRIVFPKTGNYFLTLTGPLGNRVIEPIPLTIKDNLSYLLNVDKLSSGTYYLIITNNEGTYSGKIIIAR